MDRIKQAGVCAVAVPDFNVRMISILCELKNIYDIACIGSYDNNKVLDNGAVIRFEKRFSGKLVKARRITNFFFFIAEDDVGIRALLRLYFVHGVRFVHYYPDSEISLLKNIILRFVNFFMFRLLFVLDIISLKITPWIVSCFFSQPTNKLLESQDFVPGRVVICNSSLGPGGSERQVVNTVIGLHERGYKDSSVLCSYLNKNNSSFYCPLLEAKGIIAQTARHRIHFSPIFLSYKKQILLAVLIQPLKYYHDLWRYIGEFLERRPSVVYVFQDAPEVVLAALIVGVPHIVQSFRSLSPAAYNRKDKSLVRAYAAYSKDERVTFLANSQAGRDDYADWLGISRDRIRVVYNGLHPLDWQPRPSELSNIMRSDLGLPPTAIIVGSLFRFTDEKKPLVWISMAISIVKSMPSAYCVLFGDGPGRPAMAELIHKAGVEDRVLMPGHIQDPALALSLFHVFVLCSRIEGSPNVLLEAQFMGVPVITANRGGAPETIKPGITGLVVDELLPEVLAEHVFFILNDTKWLQNARIEAPRFAIERFGINRMVDETLDVFRLPRYAV